MSAVAPAPSLVRTRVPESGLRLAAFAALATYCTLAYTPLLDPESNARAVAVVAIATVAGGALTLSARARGRRVAGLGRVALVAVAAGAALVALGVPAQLLEPGHWGALGDDLRQGVGGLNGFQWPYTGDDEWIRVAVMAGIALAVLPAAALAFWPSPRLESGRRAAASALLLCLYGVGAAERTPGGAWPLRGAALVALAGTWLWLPRLRGRDVARGGAWLVAIAAAAVGVTAAVHGHGAWIHYRDWNLFAGSGGGDVFQWDQLYGPIQWPRTGDELLDVATSQPHYWKTETLDRFDGVRWMRSDLAPGAVSRDDVPRPVDRRWLQQLTFTVRGLRSELVVGAGTMLNVDSSKLTVAASDGTTRAADAPLSRGDTYTVAAYVPEPTADQLRRAPSRFPVDLLPYTYFDLPAPGQSGLDAPDLSHRARATRVTSRTVESTVPGLPGGDAPPVRQRILASRYGQMYVLARSLAAGQPTTYDVVNSVESYLQHGFAYSERPPSRRFPLPAFLFQDRAGYCQHFSGAMALLLRMDGVPARVATGFAAGSYDSARRRYVVRDYDAHSWVEVYFSGIGWVTFDPTPALAPAVARSTPTRAALVARPSAQDRFPSTRRLNGAQGADRGRARTAAAQRGADSSAWLATLLAGAGALALAAAALRRRRASVGVERELDDLRAALERLGHSCPPRTTLAALERRLSTAAGPASARYVRALRERRYSAHGAPRPGRSERDALRRELVAGRGLRARARVYATLRPRLLPSINVARVQIRRR